MRRLPPRRRSLRRSLLSLAARAAAVDPSTWPRRRRLPLAVGLAYVAVALAVVDFTPFLVWDFFAEARTDMTAIGFFVSGEPADVRGYAAFFGPELPAGYPERHREFGVAGNFNYTVPEIYSHVGRHHRGRAAAPGAVPAEIALQKVEHGERGGMGLTRVSLWRGWAVKR